MPIIRMRGITGVKDGEYELDMTWFTNDELHQIKKLTGLRPAEYVQAIEQLDNDLVVAFGLVALGRAGLTVPASVLWQARVGAIQLDLSDLEEQAQEEGEDLPPESAPVASVAGDGRKLLSGVSSSNDGDSPQGNGQSDTGSQSSDTGSVSGQATSAA